MSLTNAAKAYEDCYAIFTKALTMPGGCRVRIGTQAKARHMQLRMNHARNLQRNLSKRIFTSSQPAWNTSEYDGLTVRIVEDTENYFWLYVEPAGDHHLLNEIEPIPEEERRTLPETDPDAFDETRLD